MKDVTEQLKEFAERYLAVDPEHVKYPLGHTPGARTAAFKAMAKDHEQFHMGMLDHWLMLTRCTLHRHQENAAPKAKPVSYDMEGTRRARDTPAPTKAADNRRDDFPGMIIIKTKPPVIQTHVDLGEVGVYKLAPKTPAPVIESLSKALTGSAAHATKAQGPAKQLPSVKPKAKLTGAALRGDYQPMPDKPVAKGKGKLQFLIPALAEEAVLEVLQKSDVGHMRKARGIGFQLEITCTPAQAKELLTLAVAGQTNVQRWEDHPQPMKYPRACGIAADRIKEALRGGK